MHLRRRLQEWNVQAGCQFLYPWFRTEFEDGCANLRNRGRQILSVHLFVDQNGLKCFGRELRKLHS